MSKKPYIGMAPLFAIAAFAVTPVAAHAETQHWYRNGTKLAEATVVPFVIFGGKVNLSQTAGLGEVNCKTAAGGTLENPTGAGAGIGGMSALAYYECKGPQCEAEALRIFGMEGREWVETKNMPASINGHPERRFVPWPMELEESIVESVNSVRLKIGVPWGAKFETPSPPGMIRTEVVCELVASEAPILKNTFEGELKPEIGIATSGNLNGINASKPSTMKFSGMSTGHLNSEAAGAGVGTGSLKYLGYFDQELLTVKP